MNNKKKIISLIIIGLLLIISVVIYYSYIDYKNKKAENEQITIYNKEDNTVIIRGKQSIDNTTNDKKYKNVETIKLDNTIVNNTSATQTYIINLNGTEKKLNIDFKYEFKQYDSGNKYHYIKGYLGQQQIFETVYDASSKEYTTSQLISKENVNKIFNISNFRTINGIDGRQYLLIYGAFEYSGDDVTSGNDTDLLFVLNDKFEIIKNDTIKSSIDEGKNYLDNAFVIHRGHDVLVKLNENNPFIKKDTFNICTEECKDDILLVGINSDSIDYLYVFKEGNLPNDTVKIEYRVYTISDNKLNYKVAGIYTTPYLINQSS